MSVQNFDRLTEQLDKIETYLDSGNLIKDSIDIIRCNNLPKQISSATGSYNKFFYLDNGVLYSQYLNAHNEFKEPIAISVNIPGYTEKDITLININNAWYIGEGCHYIFMDVMLDNFIYTLRGTLLNGHLNFSKYNKVKSCSLAVETDLNYSYDIKESPFANDDVHYYGGCTLIKTDTNILVIVFNCQDKDHNVLGCYVSKEL